MIDGTMHPNVRIDYHAGDTFLGLVRDELMRAYSKHGSPGWTHHEFYAVLLEEVDELWEEVKKQQRDEGRIVREMIQIAAMCVRHFETYGRPPV